MSRGSAANTAGSFSEHLKQALEHFGQPAWLGQHSPLAMPYFLGARLWGQAGADTVAGRGEILQQVLIEAVDTLAREDQDGRYACQILTLSFLQPRSLLDILETLNIARATYYRHTTRAIDRLRDTLIRHLNPTLRLEAPAVPPALIGRDEELARCLAYLRQRRSVGISGTSGIGKTTLGAALAARLGGQPIFWFTFRLGLNDQLGALLFTMGHFLHRHGASGLWLQLISNNGKIDAKVAPGLAQYDLVSLQSLAPLLCFDEIDLLRPTEVEEHTWILALLESLRGLAPFIFMGQHVPIEIDLHIPLAGLSLADSASLLDQAGADLAQVEFQRLYSYTRGNPRLMELFKTLHQTGEPLDAVIERISAAPSLEFLVNRIWRLLDDDERSLLRQLVVFRRPAPTDAWQTEASTFKRLVDRHLVHLDGQGGVMVWPALQMAIYQLLLPDEREGAHLAAAAIRADRGEYTAAAYHYLSGGKPDAAIWVWYHHKEQEINQGQAAAGRALFGQISQKHLHAEEQEILILLRSELDLLLGAYPQAREGLQSIAWSDERISAVRAKRLLGDVAMRQSQLDEALCAYRAGLQITAHVLESESVYFHTSLSRAYIRQRDLTQAWHEAQIARYEAENLQGWLQADLGDYTAAHHSYIAALAIAEKLGYASGIARTCSNLAQLLAQQGDFEAAACHWERATAYYQTTGNRSRLASLKANQAGLYQELGQPQAALAPAEEALALFEQLGESRGRAHAAHNLAEAHLALGHLDTAAHYASLAIEVGEPRIRPYSLLTLSEVYLAQHQFAQAEALCRQSIQVAGQNRDKSIAGYAWRSLGAIYLAQSDYTAAVSALRRSYEVFQDLGLEQEANKTQELLQKASA